ncbi:hypothetical protein ACJMK2_028156, partial [Sinanodonta woodiana]
MLRSRITVGIIHGLLLSLHLLVIYLPDIKATVGDPCPNCTGTNEICLNENGTCVCAEGFYDDNGTAPGGTCHPQIELGYTCPTVEGQQVCKDPNATCTGGNCTCSSNYYDDNGAGSGGTCKPKIELGYTCPTVEGQQVCKDPNATCNGGNCTCGSNYYDDNGAGSGGTCKPKIELGYTCPTVEGQQVCKDPNATCTGGNCTCGSNYYDDNGAGSGGTCKPKIELGYTCPTVEGQQVCKDPNATCNGGNCTCGSNYYDDNGAGSGGTCKPKIELGYTCPTVEGQQICKDPNATCNGGNCTCGSNYYDDNGAGSGGTCKPKIELGYTCPTVEGQQVCKDPNATCTGGNCTCGSNYYDDNGAGSGGTCKPKIELGFTCPTVEGQQVCKDPNATCTGGNCLCGSNYYDDNGAGSGGTCKPKIELGYTCPTVEGQQICKDPNATCIGGNCLCGSNYYDDNGAGSGGTCKPTTNLQVTLVVYNTITEYTINISWTPPSDRAAVSYYRVEYGLADATTIINRTNVGNQTSFVLNNLDPGKKYSIRIVTVNTQTDSTERNTSVTQNQTTKPSVPGALLKDMDIDASSGSITLQWNSSIGEVTGYIGSLENTTTLFKYNKTFNISGITPNQTFSGLNNGTWYNFTVQAVVGYADTMTLYSKIHSQLIRTKVQAPNPPTNLTCFNETDKSITLKWIQPEFPNGDIISYIIVINRTQPSQQQFNDTSHGTNVQYTVNGLTAGSFYTFHVYTVNENNTSTSFAEATSCATKPEMAQAPEELLITNVASRSGNVTWKKPSSLIGTLYGYSLQILIDSVCIREVIWKCTDCQGAFPNLTTSCLNASSQRSASRTELLNSQYYVAETLFPDTNYTVDVAAITGNGTGYKASTNLITKEEVPQKPFNVTVNNIQATTAFLVWNMSEPRPGNTTYTIILTGISPAGNQTFSISGFYNQYAVLTTLQEYWNYTVKVVAYTSIGHTESDSYPFRTQIAPAGSVSLFSINTGTGDDAYLTAVASWSLPSVLDRNGPIDKFYVQQSENNNVNSSKILFVQSDETYTANFSVVPERNYTFMVIAASGIINGTKYIKAYLAPAGPPIKTFENQGIAVIPLDKFSSPSQTSFQIGITDAFFMDTKNGVTKMKGLICIKQYEKVNSTIKKPSEIDNIETYAQAQKLNLNRYRIPVPPANLISGETGSKTRRKRSVYNVTVYQVGIESCANRSDNYLCNGPLTPGTSYSIIAFVCTSGFCTLSSSYGPFVTLAVPDDKVFPVGAVVGGVLGGVAALILIVVILLLLRKRSNKS